MSMSVCANAQLHTTICALFGRVCVCMCVCALAGNPNHQRAIVEQQHGQRNQDGGGYCKCTRRNHKEFKAKCTKITSHLGTRISIWYISVIMNYSTLFFFANNTNTYFSSAQRIRVGLRKSSWLCAADTSHRRPPFPSPRGPTQIWSPNMKSKSVCCVCVIEGGGGVL